VVPMFYTFIAAKELAHDDEAEVARPEPA